MDYPRLDYDGAQHTVTSGFPRALRPREKTLRNAAFAYAWGASSVPLVLDELPRRLARRGRARPLVLDEDAARYARARAPGRRRTGADDGWRGAGVGIDA